MDWSATFKLLQKEEDLLLFDIQELNDLMASLGRSSSLLHREQAIEIFVQSAANGILGGVEAASTGTVQHHDIFHPKEREAESTSL